jgi:transcriptional regulator with XRE-family HTH domain
MSKEQEQNIVKRTCKELGLTYRELGERIGVAEGTINKIASTGEISGQIQKAIELYLKTLELEDELNDYREFKSFIQKLAK